jgi:hypothetical protein
MTEPDCPHDELARNEGVTWCVLCSRRVDELNLPADSDVAAQVAEHVDAEPALVLPLSLTEARSVDDVWHTSSGRAVFLDKQGNGISPAEYERLRADVEYWRIGYDETPTGAVLSTVWLGVDYGFGMGSLLLFESAIWSAPDSGDSERGAIEIVARYPTEAHAVAGHAALLRELLGVDAVPVDDSEVEE